MCGIGGILNLKGVNPKYPISMSHVLKHRGPDDEGYLFVDFSNNIYSLRGDGTVSELDYLKHVNEFSGIIKLALVHRRLSIIDLKATGHQPMTYFQNKYIIVHNGEIYNYLELREELSKLGHCFYTQSDTEVILAAYRQWSEKCLDHLRGMWSFAIFDTLKNVLFCSRDRFGIKPFYYSLSENSFGFGSEIKALLAIQEADCTLEESNAIQFIANGNQNFNGETLVKGINELNPGCYLVYDIMAQNLKIESYYDIVVTDDYKKITMNDAINELTRLISDSVKLHLRADVPIGSCLSGGLDSSTIVATLIHHNLPYSLQTFTASFPGQQIDEVSYIKHINNHYNFSDYYTCPNSKQLWDQMDNFLWHQDLPVMNTSPFAQWEVMKLAHNNQLKVLVDGQGVDEILGGYSEFVGAYLLGLISHGRVLKFLNNIKSLHVNYKTTSILNELFRASFQILPQNFKKNIYSMQRLGPSMIGNKFKPCLKYSKFTRRISNSIRETSLLSIKNILPYLLRYEDRNSMAFSIESRVPFLDHKLVEFCVNIPDDFKIYKGWTKYVLRKSSETMLPNEIIWRKEKLGFVTPEQAWIDNLSLEIVKIVGSMDVPEIIDRNKLIQVLRSGAHNKINVSEIWKIILFIRWYNIFMLKNS